MVIDAAKGIESQTRKLFEVARQRRLPMLTFVNKLDLPARDPLALLDDIERVLGVAAVPMNWPIGAGDRFRGVFDLRRQEVLLYERAGGERRAPVSVASAGDPALAGLIGEARRAELLEAVHLLQAAGTHFEMDDYRAGRQTAVFFGSALSNFGLESFLSALVTLAPPPSLREAADGSTIDPVSTDFSGFIFKIQANMNPRHRDRVAFLRVCSGVLTKDMLVANARHGETVRLSRPSRFFGRDRQTVETAYPGDVVGLVNPGRFAIGDTLYAGSRVRYPRIPHFPAEHFGTLRLRDVKYKQFDEGIRQLEEEGLMQVVFPLHGKREPILGVVGALQFDIVEARMRHEYGVTCRVERLPHVAARWIDDDPGGALRLPQGVLETVDREERRVLLFQSEWELQYTQRENPALRLLSVA
jgi:peptide chain release factor 3